VLGELSQHIEDELFDFKCTKVHKVTSAELDISQLAIHHQNSHLHEYTPSRKLADQADIAEDSVKEGTSSIINSN
jgi:hypothetical protein